MTVTYRDTGVTYRDLRYTYRGEAARTLPVVTVEIAFSNNPGDSTFTWVDVSDYVDSISTRRGRQNELDRFDAGTANVVLINDDRRFDPAYTLGPYYGSLVPMKRIRITARWDGTTYPIFAGFVEGWPQEYPAGGSLAYVPLRCTDLFKSLSLAKLSTTFPSELTGARVGRVLDAIGWSATERDIDAGQSTVQAITLASESGLAHLHDVNYSENGLLFAARDGKATFIDRHALILATFDTSLVWGDTDPEYPYTGITIDPDGANLYNDIAVTAPALTTQTASDSSSITRFLIRSLPRATVLSTTAQMQDLANFLSSRFSQPQTRVVGMTSDGLPDGTLTIQQSFAAVLGREIGDKIRVRRRPTGGGAAIEQDSVVEAIAVDIRGPAFSFSFDLSPADSVSNYWVLGDATQSLLGTSTRLAY